jgi:hypothetical protein
MHTNAIVLNYKFVTHRKIRSYIGMAASCCIHEPSVEKNRREKILLNRNLLMFASFF